MKDIRKSRYNLAICARNVTDDLKEAIQVFMQSSLKGVDKVLVYHEDWHNSIALTIGECSTTNRILLEPLVNDIVMCCESFVRITQANTIRLSLKMVNHDTFRKFHIDGYTHRLLCSYYDPGTEWVDNDNRKYLGVGENEDIIRDWTAI